MSDSRGDEEDWAHALGSFITTFAYIERLVYELFDFFGSDEVARHGRKLRDYKDRARFLQALLRSSGLKSKDKLQELLEQTMQFSTLRNQLAHNPTFYDIYVNDETDVNRPENSGGSFL
jgi:hypothetical protein